MEFVNETDKFDQHFLVDKEIINKFIFEANLSKDDIIVEVGPGKGTISELIAPKVKKLYLIEIDRRLEKFLNKIKSKHKNIEIIYENVLDTYIPKCNKIVTSLPYSIIEPFINKIIKCDFNEILMITGNNYAKNVIEKKINKLSLLTNCFFKTQKIIDIVPESFNPKPRVLSSMLKLIPISEKDLNNELILFRNLYFYSDKKLKNALVESFIRLYYLHNKNLTQKEAKQILNIISLDNRVLDKKFSEISNDELKVLYEKCTDYLNKNIIK